MTDFGKWWNDPKKHVKRRDYWLPHLKGLRAKFEGVREPRYFTLCARSMIDVFMLVSEKILKLDPEGHSIPSVHFCEIDQEQFTEIQDMIAVENAGLFGALENVFLFKDDVFTGQYPTLESIEVALEDEHLQEDYEKVDKLLLKRSHLKIVETFPYDFMNLDFCDYYYPAPPDMLRINETISKVLDWQRRRGDDAAVKDGIEVGDFLLAVTCRHDDEGFPKEAQERLAALIKQNCDTSPDYKDRVNALKGGVDIAAWAKKDKQDFFLAGWPKDIAHSAKQHGWSTTILDYIFYDRVGDSGKTYVMACLIARFSRSKAKPEYLPAALHALDPAKRIKIKEVDLDSKDGQTLMVDLTNIVALRNEQARRKNVVELPDPNTKPE
jgi:hypothetical protein